MVPGKAAVGQRLTLLPSSGRTVRILSLWGDGGSGNVPSVSSLRLPGIDRWGHTWGLTLGKGSTAAAPAPRLLMYSLQSCVPTGGENPAFSDVVTLS